MQKTLLRNISYLHIITIIVLGLIIYANSIHGKFIWDDYGLIKNNDYIKNWSYLPKIMTENFGAGGGVKSNFYRPLQIIVHAIGYKLWGFNIAGYHLTSILLHIFAAVALYIFLNIILCNKEVPFWATLLFTAHPINTETVCYISGISDSLSLLFMLLCLIFYIKSLELKSINFYIIALLSFIMALFSKENAVILPLIILFYHYLFKKAFPAGKIIIFFGVLIVYILLRLTILAPVILPTSPPINLLQRVPGFFAALAEFPRLFFLPLDLRIEYGHRLFHISSPRVVVGMLLTVLLITAAFFKKKDNPQVTFSIGWFFISLLPVANIYPINDSFMMEHWFYVPFIGLFILFAIIICHYWQDRRPIFFLKALVVLLIIFYSYLTIKQNKYWEEPIAFYKRTLKYAPDSWRFYNMLGIEYANAGNSDEAIASYKKALEINPNLQGVYYNLGNLYKKIGRDKEALFIYHKAREIELKLIKEHYEAGNIDMNSGKPKSAIIAYKKALELEPNNLVFCNALASAYIVAGQYSQAENLLLSSLKLNYNFAPTHSLLALTYYYRKKYILAIQHCDKAVELGYKVDHQLLEMLKPFRNKT